MRYVKDSIKLSLEHDHPFLKQTLHSGFVTQDQLWEFMVRGGHESKRRSFNWRVKRLVDHGFLKRHVLSNAARTFVYSLTEEGARELVNLDDCNTAVVGFYNRDADADRIRHAIDLNDLRMALVRAGVLAGWKSDLEIRSQNAFTNYGYAKDYDALVTLRLDGQNVQFALEYERQAKAEDRYLEIAGLMHSERRVDRFVYLLPEYHLLWFVHHCFRGAHLKIYFGVSCDFKRELLSTQVIDPALRQLTLAEALKPSL
jgi:hypothetical protein